MITVCQMWCRAVCYVHTQEASSSILRMENGGSMSRRNAGDNSPSCASHDLYTHPPFRLIIFSQYVSQQIVQTNTVCRRKPFLDFF